MTTKFYIDGEWVTLIELEAAWRKIKDVRAWAEEINDRRWNYDEISVDPVTMTDMTNLMEILGKEEE